MKKCLDLDYDIVLSFAGEDRKYVEQTARYLRNKGIRVFYDMYEDTKLWGKDLYQHLDDIYQNKAKYAVIFISENYEKKLWTSHELKSAQSRAFAESEEYILPARFDNTEIPGIRKTVGNISLVDLKPTHFASKIIKKLNDIEPKNFLPNNVSYVIDALQSIYDDFGKEEIARCVTYVFEALKKTSEVERKFLAQFILNACRHRINIDLHEDITLIERVSGFSRIEILSVLNSLTNLGFEYKVIKSINGCEEEGNMQEYEQLVVQFISRVPTLELDNLTVVLSLMYFGAMRNQCIKCYTNSMSRMDFSGLARSMEDEELEIILSYISADDEPE